MGKKNKLEDELRLLESHVETLQRKLDEEVTKLNASLFEVEKQVAKISKLMMKKPAKRPAKKRSKKAPKGKK